MAKPATAGEAQRQRRSLQEKMDGWLKME